MKVRNALLALGLLAALRPAATVSFAQTANLKPATPIAASAPTAVPSLIPFSGAAVASDGKALSGETAATFQIYKDEIGGEALWVESQMVALDSAGHYKVQLGAANPNGLPADLFSSGEARWLEVQIVGEAPQPRVLLASVPYALKASDAQTLGGLPASAFVLAGVKSPGVAASASSPNLVPGINSNVTTPGGTTGYLPVFTGATTVADSILFQGTNGIGVGDIPNPTAVFDVSGKSIWRGLLNIARAGNATASGGFDSYPLLFQASSFNSSTSAPASPVFQLQVEPTGNNTATPGATFNLLANPTGGTVAETGFFINTNGTVHFAPGQTFPGTGVGTITGVTAGTALTGGGTTGNVALNVDTTKVPLLASANTFTGNQTISGTEKVTGSITGGSSLFLPNTSSATVGVVELGTTPFVSNFPANSRNAFIGGAGNFSTTGTLDVGIGSDALLNQTTGFENTGVGLFALEQNQTGSGNTAIGYAAGYESSSTAVSNSTALGYFSVVGQSNSLVLGETVIGDPGAEFVNVGIGTATPVSALEMSVSAAGALGPVLTLTNPGGDSDSGEASAALDFNTQAIPSSGYVPGARIQAVDDGSGDVNLEFLTKVVSPLQSDMEIFANGEVFISSSEAASLTVLGAASETFAVESLAADNNEGFYGAGGDASGTTNNGGNGGDFYGGNADNGTGGYGIYAYPGLSNKTTGKAALLDGNVQVNGTLSADLKEFKIDDPMDPANKYLIHSSIESSEMVNIYSGNVTTDELGIATVKLPDWFEAANGDFRYQLTVVGGRFAQAIVSKEIQNHEFVISTNATHVKVSWQVTGVRQDAYAKAHPMVAEEAKDDRERGFYIHPELYGQPEEKQIEWGRRPEAMQRMKSQREKAKSALKTAAAPIQLPRSFAPASAVGRKFTPRAVPAVKPVAAVKP